MEEWIRGRPGPGGRGKTKSRKNQADIHRPKGGTFERFVGNASQQLFMAVQSLPRATKPRYRVIGGSQPIPRWNYSRATFFTTAVVLGGGFFTKTNLAGTGGNQIIGAAAAQGNAFNFSIGDIPSIASYVALFDQFILHKITLRIKASQNTNTTGTGAILYVVCDFDNATLLASAAAAQEYNNLQELRGSDVGNGESLVIDLIPCISLATNTGNVIIPPTWQDVANTTNRHYGVKTWYATSAATDPRWDVEAQYHFGFTNTQ